jgi:site-specific DNA-cytosine methylase
VFVRSVAVIDPMKPAIARAKYAVMPWGPGTIQPNHMCQHIDRPARTIQAAFFSLCQGRHVLDMQTRRIRPLSWREMAKLQGFDHTLFDIDGISEKERIRLIGNAIPPPLVEVVCRNIVDSGLCNFGNSRTFVEICAGTGAMGKVLEGLDFQPLGLIDNDPMSCKFLRTHSENKKIVLNRKKVDLVVEKSVTDVNFSQYGKIGILCGGPPCQPYSTMGHKKGKGDSRDLLAMMDKVVAVSQPEAFIFENVTGVVHGQRAKEAFSKILVKLRSPGKGLKYDVDYQELNAVNYGVPQRRRRIFIVGVKVNGAKRKRGSVRHVLDDIVKQGIYGKSPEHPVKTIREFLDDDDIAIPWKYYPHHSPFD